jgi:hypothetical protein
MNDNLNCNSCLLGYNIESRRPMVLPCGHTLCSKCIDSKRDIKDYIKCPYDRNKYHYIKDNILINPFILNTINSKNRQIINELIEKSERDISAKDSEKYKVRIIHKTNNFSLHGKNNIYLNSFDASKISILFTYFDVVRSFIGVFDNMNIHSNLIILPLKAIAIVLVIFLNYVFIAYKAFMKIFVFIILINDSRRKIINDNKSDIIISIKRWISFMTIVLLDELVIYILSILNLSLLWLLWDCILTIYVLIMVGPLSAVDMIIDGLYMTLDKMNLLA